MIYHILAVGDVVGESGLDHLARNLRPLKQFRGIHFAVVNGENAAGTGLTPAHVDALYAAGADVVTLGNHAFAKAQIVPRLEDDPYLLRPANYTGRAPGRGWGVFDCGHIRVGVMNLIGRCGLDFHADNPFTTADRLLRGGERPLFTLVDFHAEATSEKLAMAYYLDGRVSALWVYHRPGHDGARAERPGRAAGAERGDVSGGPSGPLPDCGGGVQIAGRGVLPGQRHRALRGGGAGGCPVRADRAVC